MTLSVQMKGGREPFQFYSERAFKAIDGKDPMAQLALLQEYVEQGVRDKEAGYGPPLDEINILRRRFIRIASEVYRGRTA